MSTTKLSPADLQTVSAASGIQVHLLQAITQVESNGSGELPDGRVKILLEGQVLWKRLVARAIDPHPLSASHPDVCYPQATTAHYRGGAGEYARIDEGLSWASANAPAEFESYKKALYEACSWGLFQLLGENYAGAGYADIYQMVHDFEASEKAQLQAIVKWMEGNGLATLLKAHNWQAFALGYNGPKYKTQYAQKLADAYARLST